MHTSKFPGFCGNVNWMTVGWEDCGSFAADATWDVPPVDSAVTGKAWLADAGTGTATQQQTSVSPPYRQPWDNAAAGKRD